MKKIMSDAHTHLNFEKYTDEERRRLAEEISASAVKLVVDAGDSIESSIVAVRNAREYDWCYAAVGIHPSQALSTTDRDLDEIGYIASENMISAGGKVVAIGEIGLDFYYGKDSKSEQEEIFRAQIRIANNLKLPIMVHTRDADMLTMEILKDEDAFSDERIAMFPKRPDGKGGEIHDARVQLHCYSGSAELAQEYVRLGATISIGGPVTFKNGRKTVRVVRELPPEFIMSETDAPFLAPEPMRGRQNKVQYVEHIIRRIAFLKGMEFEETAELLTANAERFFGIASN